MRKNLIIGALLRLDTPRKTYLEASQLNLVNALGV